ncbi:aldehyde ferredoxin oxidoreductase C-terminal domain-containing protein, partial [Myxococcota bacterium]|nr:aldehyde ferredoxin oxidoreductase C-terminal domain-containing protein [Myxococcota bacterium]
SVKPGTALQQPRRVPRSSDTLPKRFTEEPSTFGGSEGHVSELSDMLTEYYEARGWNEGVVPDSKLESLGII